MVLLSSQLCTLLQPLATNHPEAWNSLSHFARAWTISMAGAVRSMEQAHVPAAAPGSRLQHRQQLLANVLQAARWSWQRPQVARGTPFEILEAAELATIVLAVLQCLPVDACGAVDQLRQQSPGQSPGQGAVTAADQGPVVPLPPAAVMALDCLAVLALDAAGSQALRASMDLEHLKALRTIASAQGVWAAAGAGRPVTARCALSAALVMMTYGAQDAAQGNLDPAACAQWVSSRLVSVTRTAGALLQTLTDELHAAHTASRQQQGTDSKWAGSVLSEVESPADVAAALATSLTLVWAFVGPKGQGLASGSGCSGTMLQARLMCVKLLHISAWVMQALAAWLAEETRASGWGWTHEVWRVALQEYGVCSAALEVRPGPSNPCSVPHVP